MCENVTFYDLENSEDLSRLYNPILVLKSLRGLVILDEIQRKPDIFATLRVLADREDSKTKFLVLGSASPLADILTNWPTAIIDSGIRHNLLGIRNMGELEKHPKCGASWEGFVKGIP